MLVFTDDDCRVAGHWLSAVAEAMAKNPGCAIGGHVINGLPANRYAEASQLLIDYLHEYYNGPDGEGNFYTSNNLAFPTTSFRQAGGFDVRFRGTGGEDRELCRRWHRSGNRFVYEARMEVSHFPGLDLPRFLRQHFSYGRGASLYRLCCREARNERVRLEPARFYRQLILYPHRRDRPHAAQLAVLFCLSQVANAVGYVVGRAAWALRAAWPTPALSDVARRGAKRLAATCRPAPRPLRLQVDVTDRCNLRCPMCSKWRHAPSERELGTAEWLDVLARTAPLPILREVTFCGGEPLAREDILPILTGAARQGLRVTVLSNGWNLDEAMLAQLEEAGVERLVLSLNSLRPAIHDESRGRNGSFARIMRTLDAWDGSPGRMQLGLAVVIMEQNCRELADIAEFVRQRGLDGVIYQVLLPVEAHYAFCHDRNMPPENLARLRRDPRWVRSTSALRTGIRSLLMLRRSGLVRNPAFQLRRMPLYYERPEAVRRWPCIGTLTRLYIDPFGDARLCYGFAPVGNVLQDNPLSLWRSVKAGRIRKEAAACNRLCRMQNSSI